MTKTTSSKVIGDFEKIRSVVVVKRVMSMTKVMAD